MPDEKRNFFDDEDFQDLLVALLCTDVLALRRCSPLLIPDDFKPLRGARFGRPRWLAANQALEYYRNYHEPVGRMLRTVILDTAEKIGLGERQIGEAEEYLKHLKTVKLISAQAIADKVVQYKRQRMKASAINELIDLQSSGHLTDDKWLDISRRAIAAFQNDDVVTDFTEDLEARVTRRMNQKRTRRVPALLIDPVDNLVRMIGPGELGLMFGPYKRGKSLSLTWIALAYLLQRLNILYITLEDARQAVEDRMDSAVTGVPFADLTEKPNTTRRRFEHYKKFIRTKLKIVDGTLGGWTVPRIEQLILRQRDQGFYPDALIVDYDAKLVASKSYKERRFEFDAIYTELIQCASRFNMIVWTGAQTQRNTEGLKVLSGDKIGDDINKIRNVTMALSLGKGDWGDDESVYVWVAAHRLDRQHVGANIMCDRSRSMIYDREATIKKIREEEALAGSEGEAY